MQFLAEELNKYFNVKIPGGDVNQPRLVVGNIALSAEVTAPNPDVKNKAVLSLVNIEEDRIARQQENYVKTNTSTVYKSPPIHLNLFILFSVNRGRYDECLNFLSNIIQFFQYQNVFTPITHPSLDSRIQKLMVDLHTLNFEQSNHLWSILGGKYLPSVMYKVRQLTLDEDLTISESGLIKEIQLNDKLKMPVS